MSIKPELREKLTGEVKQFSTALNLSGDQKQKLQESLSYAYQRVQEYKQQNPGASKEDWSERSRRIVSRFGSA